jgi:uncharacterized protein (TIGR02646 family)
VRRIKRTALPKAAQTYLNHRQFALNTIRSQHKLDIESEWKTARQTKAIKAALSTLQGMMGARQRCMYCMNSHGADIDHFQPKAVYPQATFKWPNLLLCCTECGRFKGNQFPLAGRHPLLIDPTAEDPWIHLDFDPDTGNITARFDEHANNWSMKGVKTVQVLQLDRREALSAVYLISFRRLASVVQKFLAGEIGTTESLIAHLKDANDHGLLGWCFGATGQGIQPFSDLYRKCPLVWARCCEVL